MLFEFLPQDYKKEAKKIYLSKIATLYSIGILFIFGISIFFLLPSYILAKFEKRATIEESEALQKTLEDAKETEAKEFVVLAKSKISYARESINKKQFTEALSRITDNDRSTISITAITFERRTESNQITISGTADTRDELLGFIKVLETESIFSAIELPVSNLAKNKDIDFSIAITQPI